MTKALDEELDLGQHTEEKIKLLRKWHWEEGVRSTRSFWMAGNMTAVGGTGKAHLSVNLLVLHTVMLL